eukprot:CAMPEP_0179278396 /NCGR_PEP_ID=MMETSP0797-20121207/35585_1 /TAXON_ID=47934 /ORGANISM="Dinophysis acuminata, Strain DAEP01" /LENGTH=118 /DNA_ID=CAMNT_0020987009 /DNA_START=201 /DNA_END=557 /DNA_ORIENTATION=-
MSVLMSLKAAPILVGHDIVGDDELVVDVVVELLDRIFQLIVDTLSEHVKVVVLADVNAVVLVEIVVELGEFFVRRGRAEQRRVRGNGLVVRRAKGCDDPFGELFKVILEAVHEGVEPG